MFYQGPYEFAGRVKHIFLWHEDHYNGLALEDIVEYQGPIYPNGEILC